MRFKKSILYLNISLFIVVAFLGVYTFIPAGRELIKSALAAVGPINGIAGQGFVNRIARFASGADLSPTNSIGDSIIYDNGTNVGIGNTTPDYKLDVGPKTGGPQTATSGAGGLIRNGAPADLSPYTQARIMLYGGTNIDNNNYAYLGYGSDAIMRIVYGNTTQARALQIGQATSFSGGGAFTPELVVANGNVGIGTTGPVNKFVVSNAGAAGIEFAPSTGSIFGYNRTSSAYTPLLISGSTLGFSIAGATAALSINASGNVGIGTGVTAPSQRLDVLGNIVASGTLPTNGTIGANQFCLNPAGGCITAWPAGGGQWTTSGTNIYNSNTGNVGIGVPNPLAKLDVSAGIRVNSVGTVTSGFANGVNMGTWDALGYDSAGVKVVLGGYRASQFSQVGLYTSGTERVTITAGGHVGIGTSNPTSPWSKVLQVYDANNAALSVKAARDWQFSTSADGKLNIYDNTASAERITIDSAGDVGIGQSNPATRLSMAQDSGEISWGNNDGVTKRASIVGLSSNDLTFSIVNLEKMRIRESGNVGIGTSVPLAKLDVYGAGSAINATISNMAAGSILLENTDGGVTGSTVGLFAAQAATGGLPAGIGFKRDTNADWGTNIIFYNHPAPTTNINTLTEVMRIDKAGNVGIGTTAPYRTLDLNTNGQITFGNNGYSSTGSPGIFWHSTNTDYGIYKTAGTWVPNTYQQLKLAWDTGIILAPNPAGNPGYYDKSYVDIQGAMRLQPLAADPAANSLTNGLMWMRQ